MVVLAAGSGTRMHSSRPKPMHTVAGIPMIERVLRAGDGARPDVVTLVVGRDTAGLASELKRADAALSVVQDPPLGTGDAVRLALDSLADVDRMVVLYCDHPLLEPRSVAQLLEGSRASGAKVTILSAVLTDAAEYGRIVRDEAGRPVGVAERKDDDPIQRAGATEIIAGLMALDTHWAREALARLKPSNAAGELYLTDLIAMAVDDAQPGDPWPVAVVEGSADDALGVNDRLDLERAESRAWARKRERLMRGGVTMRLPETITVDEDVVIGADTVILPQSYLMGTTTIGSGCLIGPGAILTDVQVGDRVIIRSSTVEDTTIADDSDVGPYAHLRGGTDVGPRVHIGNFVELKNAHLAAGVKVGHFSYLGDAAVGDNANIGAGTVTANFDGTSKHRTIIGARAFIGSDTIVRAPVRIGDDARTGAGSVVTRDVPDGATVVGVPARVVQRSSSESRRETEEG